MRQLLPLAIPFSFAVALLGLFEPILALPALGYILAMLVLGLFVGLKEGSACAMLSGIPAIIMHTAWGAGFVQEMVRHPRGVPTRFGFSTDIDADNGSPAS